MRPVPRLRQCSSPGTPNAAALRRMRAARSARRSIAIARIAGSASSHSIATEPEPAPMSHKQFAAARRKRRQRHRANFALGDLAVVLEQIVGRPGVRARTRASGASVTSIATILSASDRAELKSRGRRGADALARTAERFEHGQARRAETGFRSGASPARPAPSPSEVSARISEAGCKCGRTRSSMRPCSDSNIAPLQRPAEPGRGQAEGRRRRHDEPSHAHRCAAPAPRRRRSGTDRPRRARRPAGRDGAKLLRARRRTGSAKAAPRRE